MRSLALAPPLLFVIVHGCISEDTTPCTTVTAHPTVTATPIVERDPSPMPLVYAVSDIHGGYDRLVLLLAKHGLIDGNSRAWTGGDAQLVVVGDLIDKGPQPVEVIDLMRSLEPHAIVLLGNHEAEFFADPNNSKTSANTGFNAALSHQHIDCGSVASGIEPRGAWLAARPVGARIGKWFFAHAGQTHALDAAQLSARFGGHSFAELTAADSILEARDWFSDAAVNARALGVDHIVVGHDPSALGPRGSIAHSGVVFRIDCGMSPDVDDSTGCLLRIRPDGGAEQLKSDGSVLAI